MSVKLINNSEKVKKQMDAALIAALYTVAGKVTASAKSNTPVDTGQLKNSWTYKIDEEKLEATIGSPLENAIWNELGTGEYALYNNGRKGGWTYKDKKGKWHYTFGKRPMRTLYIAFSQNQNSIKRIFENELREAMNSSNSGSSSKWSVTSTIKEIYSTAKNAKRKTENTIQKAEDELEEW